MLYWAVLVVPAFGHSGNSCSAKYAGSPLIPPSSAGAKGASVFPAAAGSKRWPDISITIAWPGYPSARGAAVIACHCPTSTTIALTSPRGWMMWHCGAPGLALREAASPCWGQVKNANAPSSATNVSAQPWLGVGVV